jgi:hypothetical protein
MDGVYQKLIDRTRQELDIDQLKTLFGHTHRPHNQAKRGRAPELSKTVNSPHGKFVLRCKSLIFS